MSKDWEKLKESGNEEFKKKNYNTAINLYSQAIGKQKSNLTKNKTFRHKPKRRSTLRQ